MAQQWYDGQHRILFHPFSLLLFSFLFFLLKFSISSTKNRNLPPSPPKLPIIGNLHQLGTLVHRSLHSLSQKYGPLMFMQLGTTPTLVVSSAEMAREITKTHDLDFADRARTTVAKKFFYGCTDIAFTPYGEYWKQMRKIGVFHLLSIKRVQSFEFVRREEVATMIETISSSCRVGTPINTSELLNTLFTNIISRVAFGKKYGEENDNNKLPHLIRELINLLGAFCMRDYFPLLGWIDTLTGLDGRIKRNFKALDSFLDQVIDDHLTAKRDGHHANQEDFVDIMLHAQKDITLDIPLTRDNIKADMFGGGIDTTSGTMEWAMAELVKNPSVMKKAQEEVRRVVGNKSNVEVDDIQKMDYLKCIIKETFRLHPPTALLIPRTSVVATNVKGYYIPSNTKVFINAWAIQRDPKLWDMPKEFYPDRFINNSVDFKGQDYQLIPFGSGRRGCPGMTFSLASIEFLLANLLYWFNWEVPGDTNKDGPDMTEGFGITVYKKEPLHLLPTFPLL